MSLEKDRFAAIEMNAILRPPVKANDEAGTGWTWEVWAHKTIGDWSSSEMLEHGGPVPPGNAGADAAACIGRYSRLIAFAAKGGGG